LLDPLRSISYVYLKALKSLQKKNPDDRSQMADMSMEVENVPGGEVTIVTYHHFSYIPCPLGIATRPDRFLAQLDHFARNYNVISLMRLLSGDIPKRAILITIDDAYKSVIEFAAQALKARRLPAVYFVNPKPVAEPFVPLENLLSLACSRLGIVDVASVASMGAFSTRSLAVLSGRYLSKMPASELAKIKARILTRLSCTEAELHRSLDLFIRPTDLRLLKDYGIEIANHTMTHARCGLLSQGELRVEIEDAKQLLEEMAGTPVRAFAFPWGQERDATPAALAAIRASGHRATFLMHARRNANRPASDIWYRVPVTNEEGWRLRVALELLPGLRSLRLALS
jgi:peptidoglycan/xylan/chitin deacetylase (PgdA/CDA1 family)